MAKASEEITILAVADGHGSESCPYSKSGSRIAVNVFCKVMQELLAGFDDRQDNLPTFLNREGETQIARTVETLWKRQVVKAHTNSHREDPLDAEGKKDKAAICRQYGTTLLGLMIAPSFIFALQIGDGEMVLVSPQKVQTVIEGDKILGVETHSLSRENAWKSIHTVVRLREMKQDEPYLYVMSTDGFANSYRAEQDLEQTYLAYLEAIREHGMNAVVLNLKDWLEETSSLGCGDDITVVLFYYEGDREKGPRAFL